jgi:PEP-CTERM/exosortase A-associated glycosyltransferase
MMDISFVILTWNSAAYIQQCCDSIISSLKPLNLCYEVFIIDNGSTDRTAELLREYQTSYPNVFKPIFLIDNKGTTLSRNIGLKQATGRMVCVMDSDVVLSDNLFPRLIETLESDSSIGMVVPKINYPSGTWQKSYDQFPTIAHKLKRFFKLRSMEAKEGRQQLGQVEARPVDYAISAFWLFKREILAETGYLDERIFYSPEDVDFCLRVWNAGYKIIYVPAVNIIHHTQEISRGFKFTRAKLSHIKGLCYLFYKHRYFLKPPQFSQLREQTINKKQGSTDLKILHLFDHSLPLHDGYSFRSMNILKEQRKRGWLPVALTSPKHEEGLQKECSGRETIEGFTFYRSGATGKIALPLISEIALMYTFSRRILVVARQENVDILHAHSPILNAIPALWAGRKLGLPVVYEIRAFWEDAAVDQGSCKEWGLRYRLTRYLETWVCKKADHIAILCNGLKDDLVKRGIPANKITPVFNGVNADAFKPCSVDVEYQRSWGLEGKKVIGFIGSFYRYEGLDLLVKSFAQLARQNNDAMLLMVGGGEMAAELTALTSSLNLTDRVVMPGRIPHERVPGVYAMIDILAYPRYSMRLTELVTPLKPLESMAMGKVVVASDVGGHKELIADGKTGVLFTSGDENALATTLAELLADESRRRQLEKNGLEWVREQHTWERTTGVYRDIYTEIGLKNS